MCVYGVMGKPWVSWNVRGLNRSTKMMAVKKAFCSGETKCLVSARDKTGAR